MSVTDERVYIDAPYTHALGAFERRLGLEHGATEGRCELLLVAPVADGRDIAREVAARTQRLPGAANFTSHYHIEWDSGLTPRGIPTPGFAGTLTLRAGEDYSECELELHGRYDPPGGIPGMLFDSMVGRRIARATLGALLDGVGRNLSDAHRKIEAWKHGD